MKLNVLFARKSGTLKSCDKQLLISEISSRLLVLLLVDAYGMQKQCTTALFQKFPISVSILKVFVRELSYACQINNTIEHRLWDIFWQLEALFIYNLPIIFDFVVNEFTCLFLWNAILLHATFYCWSNMYSFLLKL